MQETSKTAFFNGLLDQANSGVKNGLQRDNLSLWPVLVLSILQSINHPIFIPSALNFAPKRVNWACGREFGIEWLQLLEAVVRRTICSLAKKRAKKIQV